MNIKDKHVAILAEDVYQELELHYPRLRLLEAGARVSVLGAGKDVYQSKKGYVAECDGDIADVDAGGEWVDETVVVDGNLTSSRVPGDLPEFCKALLNALEH